MVEIFKTNVRKRGEANLLIEQIERTFPECKASFDLEDCDHVLRIHCASREVKVDRLIALLNNFGYEAEILSDEILYPYLAYDIL
jgi:exoribonuclease R